MRRKSKPRVVWLPQTNLNSIDAGGLSTWNFQASGALDDTQGGASLVIEAPIVQDGPASDPLDPNSSLADITGSGYRLRRIVGKLWVFVGQTRIVDASLIGVTAGFIIRRVDNGGTSLASQVAQTQQNPATVNNAMDPWIWRRSWLLGNGPTGFSDTAALDKDFAGALQRSDPGSNNGRNSGSALEGPHVDQKTARIVGPEERLFLNVSASVVLPGADAVTTTLLIVYDLRVLASMRSTVGNRRNASR